MNRALIFLLLLCASHIQAAGHGITVYKVNAQASRAHILVFRAGKLARFGHDHVISTTDIEGKVEVATNFVDSRADLVVSLDTLEVDREELRHEYGIETKLSTSAKMGTRKNMLDKVLHSADWPDVSIGATVVEPDRQEPVLNISFTLHGIKQDFKLPVTLQVNGEELRVQGTLNLLQTDYGIKPFSRMAGALRVDDRVEIHFDLVANRRQSEKTDKQQEVARE